MGCRTSFELKKLHVANTPEMWIRKDGALDPIIPAELFYTVRGIMQGRAGRYTDEELVERLRRLYEQRGFLSGLVINETEGMPSTVVYSHRFGQAYRTVGFSPDRDYRYLEATRFLRRFHPEIVSQTGAGIAALGGSVARDPATDMLRLSGEFSVSLVLSRCQEHAAGRFSWKVRFDTSLAPDITAAVRLDHANQPPLDYYLLPRLDFDLARVNLHERKPIEFETYRFDTLDYLYHMSVNHSAM